MLQRIAEFVVRRKRFVLVASLVVLLAAGAVGGNVAQKLSSGGFEDPGAESTRAGDAIEDVFGQGDPNLVLLVTAKGGDVDAPAVAEKGVALTQEVAGMDGVIQSVSYWSLGNAPPLKSEQGHQALVLARITGTEDEIDERVAEIAPDLARSDADVTVEVGGFAEVFRQVGTTIEEDLARAEMFAFPLTLLLLILVFGSVVAAGLPLGLGIFSIIGTFFALSVIASLTQVSIFSLNLTTGMGMGLAIDYSLFIVSRYREELRNGLAVDAAVIRTVKTAGRTVLFSALTVAASLSALLVFPLAFLRSFAYAGIAVVLIAAIGSIVVIPAVLAALGTRVDKFVLVKRRKGLETDDGESGFWHRAALAVMRRPIAFGGSVMVILLALGIPFLGIEFGLPDDRVLPEGHEGRTVQDELRANFSSQEAGATTVVATGIGDLQSQTPAIETYAASLSKATNVSRVDAVTGSYVGGQKVLEPSPLHLRFAADGATWLSVVPTVEPNSAQGEAQVKSVRSVDAPFPVLVGGPSAQLVDSKASLFGAFPLALGIIAVVTLVLLFMMFGSVLVPLKAIVLNLLSLTATFGAMVWIFQDGNLSGFLNFTPGPLDASSPILMFCIAFGLSMDYEVFLLSRIKEEHDRTGDNTASVAVGLEKTGRIVTAAAALLAVVFLAFVSSEVRFIKLFGLGLAMAVLVDATLVRAVLVPAFMRLAGEANWWAPKPLKRFYDRFGISEHAPEDRHVAAVEAPATADERAVVTEAETVLDRTGKPRRPRPLVAAGREKQE